VSCNAARHPFFHNLRLRPSISPSICRAPCGTVVMSFRSTQFTAVAIRLSGATELGIVDGTASPITFTHAGGVVGGTICAPRFALSPSPEAWCCWGNDNAEEVAWIERLGGGRQAGGDDWMVDVIPPPTPSPEALVSWGNEHY
jgi:hypothetical protein